MQVQELSVPENQAFDQLKSSFVNEISHEIRTPLSIILLSAQLLESHGCQCSDEQKQTYLKQIQTAAKQINALFNQALVSIGADPACEPTENNQTAEL